jgi:hydrogenase-4 component B
VDGFMSEWLVIAGTILAAASGVPGLFLKRNNPAGERWATAVLVAAAGSGITGAIAAAISVSTGIDLPWSVPGGRFAVRIDGLSAPFVVQIFLLATVGSVFGLSYWSQGDHARDGRKLRLFYGLMAASMVLLVCARNAMLFIAGWEIMSIAAFLSLSAQDDQKTVRDAGYLYMAATRLATLCLFAMFAVLFVSTGTFDFAAPAPAITSSAANAVFFLALAAFGLKAGIMPMHVWLPGAHANAPSHVSALMSGVLIKMGIYGLLRVFSLFPHPPLWWGQIVLLFGAVSGVLGVAFAIGQHDFKRLLAYHSVENIGIICLGLGVALLGRSLGNNVLVALGIGGALLHVWNHGLFKALLFLSAGSVLHATHTREIDRLGGLAKRMPWTAAAFLIGAVAICGLPPLNGFVSELLVFLGLFRSAALPQGALWLAGALGAPALALIGSLALACFVKAFGSMFLGEPRSEHGGTAQESGRFMLGPMAGLATLCLVVGVAPWVVAPLLDAAVAAWAPERAATLQTLVQLAPFGWVSLLSSLLLACLAVGFVLLRARMRRTASDRIGTWDCGYAAPGPTMQYSSSSFAQTIVGLFSWALRPKVNNPGTHDLFPRPQVFASEVADPVLDRFLIPTAQRGSRIARWFRWFQHGSQQIYLLYILLTLIVLLLWR